jgi:dephospho-CoA kinase
MFDNLPEGDYIIDSIRHIDASVYLRKKYGDNYKHVFVKASDKVRFTRIRKKYGIDNEQIKKWELADTETANNELVKMADVIIDTNGSMEELTQQLDDLFKQLK